MNYKKSMRVCMATVPRDWSINPDDAWLYGIVHGWSDDALEELSALHGWSTEDVTRLKQLHMDFSVS